MLNFKSELLLIFALSGVANFAHAEICSSWLEPLVQISPLDVSTGTTLNNFTSTACNAENFNITSGGTFNNYGVFYNLYDTWPNSNNTLTISTGGSVNNLAGASFYNYGRIDNYGNLSNLGTLDTNYGQLINYGMLLNNGAWLIDRSRSNSVNNLASGTIINNGVFTLSGTVNNSGTFTNNGVIFLSDGYGGNYRGSIEGNGTLINNSTISTHYASGISASLIQNNGTISIGGYSETYLSPIGNIGGTGNLLIKSAVSDAGYGSLTVNGNLSQSSLVIDGGSLTVGGGINSNVMVGGDGYPSTLSANSINGDLTVYTGGVTNGITSVSGDVSLLGGKIVGSIDVGGNLILGGTFDIFLNELSPRNFSINHVNGLATFADSIVNVDFGDYKPIIGDTWIFLSADGGLTGYDSISFIGTSSAFTSYDKPQFHAALVNNSLFLTVTAVPESETYAMLLAGLGVMGFMSRRKQE